MNKLKFYFTDYYRNIKFTEKIKIFKYIMIKNKRLDKDMYIISFDNALNL